MDKPSEQADKVIAGFADQLAWPQAMAVGCLLDHPLGRGHLGLADRRARLDIHDHRIVEVDQVVDGVAEVDAVALRPGIVGRRKYRRNALRLNRRRAA